MMEDLVALSETQEEWEHPERMPFTHADAKRTFELFTRQLLHNRVTPNTEGGTLVYVAGILRSATTFLEWYMNRTAPLSATRGFYMTLTTWARSRYICVPEHINVRWKGLVSLTGDVNHTGIFNSLTSASYLDVEKAMESLKIVGEFILSHSEGKALSTAAGTSLESIPDPIDRKFSYFFSEDAKIFITGEHYLRCTVDKRFDNINRISALYDAASNLPQGWQQTYTRYKVNVHWVSSFMHRVAIRVGRLMCGLCHNGTIRHTKSVKLRSEFIGDEHLYADSVTLFRVPVSARSMMVKAGAITILDTEEGLRDVNLYEQFQKVLYLMFTYWSRKSEDTRNRLSGYIEEYCAGDAPTIYQTSKETGSVQASVQLSRVVAGIGNPSFERFNDKRHRTTQSFDYITVDVMLVTKYGKESLTVARAHLKELSGLVMQHISTNRRLKDKQLLRDLLYVKEYTICGNGFILTAWIEFKPGVEETLESLGTAESNKYTKKLNLE